MAQILLLEPDNQLAAIYSKALQMAGHTVSWCKEAGEAINILDTHSIDLILLEIQLALHNGVEFLYEMRSYPEWQAIPVIIHSVVPAQVIKNNKLLMKQLNISEVVYKPDTSLKQMVTYVNRNVSSSGENSEFPQAITDHEQHAYTVSYKSVL